jgi:glutathione S-transferase
MGLDYLSVAEARDLPGLRLVLSAHVPGPWGESAKAVFKARGVPFVPVFQEILAPNEELVAWTGIRNAPIAVYDDEPPQTGWHEIVLMAERLGSGPSLLPDDPLDRALAMGISSEICSPGGLGWTRRLEMMVTRDNRNWTDNIRRGYGLSPDAVADAPERIASILKGLSEQLRRQRDRGLEYLVGSRLSACDIHWACFSYMVSSLSETNCPMPANMRRLYDAVSDHTKAALDPALVRHRDMVLERHVGLPLSF